MSAPNDEIQVRRSEREREKVRRWARRFSNLYEHVVFPRLGTKAKLRSRCLSSAPGLSCVWCKQVSTPLTSIWWLAYCLETRRDDLVLWRKLARKFNSIKSNARSGYGFLFWVKAEQRVRNSNPEGQDGLQDLLNHIWNMFPLLPSPPCSYNWPTGITQHALTLFHMCLFLIRGLYLIFSCAMSSVPIQVSNSVSLTGDSVHTLGRTWKKKMWSRTFSEGENFYVLFNLKTFIFFFLHFPILKRPTQ